MKYIELREQICDIGKRIYNKGFVAANDGNISIRISENEVLSTPTGVSKGFMKPEMLIITDMQGNLIEGELKPTSELKMHLQVYREREDVNSVVHAHPPYATTFAVLGKPLTKPIMPEAILFLGYVPVVEYGTPSTKEIPEKLSKYLHEFDAFLLENHGALTVGENLEKAYFKMESMEFYAQVLYLSESIGKPQEISQENIDKLIELRKSFNIKGKYPGIYKK
ncbi:class II aldolase/adducin family protein [Caldicellulosiruptoraceae bacterium PP1]